MKVMALEFKIGEHIFAVEMKDVKHLFEIEKKDIIAFPNMPDGMVGIVRYHNYVYPLISLRKIFDLEGEDSNTAFVLIYGEKEYAILIDEVIKIDEIEKKSNFLLDVFADGDKLIEEFNLSFVKDINIPIFHNKKSSFDIKIHKNQQSFLIFKCKDEILGVDIKLIKKVDEYTGGNLILNGILPVLDFSKIYKSCENENIIVLEKDKTLGITIGEIIDVVFIDEDKIVNATGMFDKFFLYENREVKVFNNEYLFEKIDKFGVHLLKESEKKLLNTTEVLIVSLLGIKFAIRMKNILGIFDYNDAKLNVTAQSEYVKGILPTGRGAVYVISLEKVFNKKYNFTEDSKIILLKHKITKALLVDRIEDLIEVSIDNVIEAESNNYIGGMVLLEGEMIPLFNLEFPKKI